MGSLFDGLDTYVSSWLPPIGALLTIVVFQALICGLALGLILTAAWKGCSSVFRTTTGRPFVFTRRMAYFLSCVWGLAVSAGCASQIIHAVAEGAITTHPRHGAPQVYYWFNDPSGFLWAIFELFVTCIGLWAIIAVALLKAAEFSTGGSAAKTPTPPQTAPR